MSRSRFNQSYLISAGDCLRIGSSDYQKVNNVTMAKHNLQTT